MSINDFTNKIKGRLGIDTFTLMCLFVIVGVGISAFGLGRLSVDVNFNKDLDILIQNKNEELDYKVKGSTSISNDYLKEKRYVASKSGKLYYTIGCSGAKRISSKNQIYFATSIDAEKSGYTFSSSCK